jgi:hypothetical protein
MEIWKFKLMITDEQLVKMPSKSEIMDIQMQENSPVMWALCDPDTEDIDVQINLYGTGFDVHNSDIEHEYLATVQSGAMVWHFFMVSEQLTDND